jgi:transcriptional regulator
LTKEQVLKIRELVEQGAKQKAVARHFGISNASVSAIITRRTWKDI